MRLLIDVEDILNVPEEVLTGLKEDDSVVIFTGQESTIPVSVTRILSDTKASVEYIDIHSSTTENERIFLYGRYIAKGRPGEDTRICSLKIRDSLSENCLKSAGVNTQYAREPEEKKTSHIIKKTY